MRWMILVILAVVMFGCISAQWERPKNDTWFTVALYGPQEKFNIPEPKAGGTIEDAKRDAFQCETDAAAYGDQKAQAWSRQTGDVATMDSLFGRGSSRRSESRHRAHHAVEQANDYYQRCLEMAGYVRPAR